MATLARRLHWLGTHTAQEPTMSRLSIAATALVAAIILLPLVANLVG